MQTVTAAMKLKDIYSLEGKLWQTLTEYYKAETIAEKGLYSQTYGFSSSYAWTWELDRKEGWALKNWCFHAGEDSWKFFGLQGDQTSQY